MLVKHARLKEQIHKTKKHVCPDVLQITTRTISQSGGILHKKLPFWYLSSSDNERRRAQLQDKALSSTPKRKDTTLWLWSIKTADPNLLCFLGTILGWFTPKLSSGMLPWVCTSICTGIQYHTQA